MPERRVGWQPSRFLTDRAEVERAFALAEQLGSVNAAAKELGTPSRCARPSTSSRSRRRRTLTGGTGQRSPRTSSRNAKTVPCATFAPGSVIGAGVHLPDRQSPRGASCLSRSTAATPHSPALAVDLKPVCSVLHLSPEPPEIAWQCCLPRRRLAADRASAD
jgi:hypothetical protein